MVSVTLIGKPKPNIFSGPDTIDDQMKWTHPGDHNHFTFHRQYSLHQQQSKLVINAVDNARMITVSRGVIDYQHQLLLAMVGVQWTSSFVQKLFRESTQYNPLWSICWEVSMILLIQENIINLHIFLEDIL